MRPRSAQERKWSQHGLNMAEGSLGRWNGWPPLKHVKAGIYSLYIKAYCFDTPGHRKRCGGFSGSAIPPTPLGLGNAQSPPKSNPRAPNPRPRTPTSDQEAPKTHPNGFQQRPPAKIEPTWPQGACTTPPKSNMTALFSFFVLTSGSSS